MTTATIEPEAHSPTAADKIICKIDNQPCHSIERHIKEFHADWSVERYRQEFPNEPLLSDFALSKLAEIRRKKEAEKKLTENLNTGLSRPKHGPTLVRKPFHEVFGIGNIPAAMSEATKQPIPISVFENLDETDAALVPDIDENYVFLVELLKMVMISFELNMTMYAWGYHGTGKTTLFEQAAARTGRPFMRIQHTANTEEAEIIGQWVVDAKDGVSVTEFQLGPLPTAMVNGYVFCADEYDVAGPGIVALYQSVLEGKPLYIKNAPPALRMIRPHPNFRFVATGNTNGGGDESGLYQGTQIQNAANYSRFRITEEVTYMDEKLEVAVVQGQARIEKRDSERLVKFANMVREQFKSGKIGMTVSPRELISAGLLGRVRGGNFRKGLEAAFINRLSRVDKEAVSQLAQRIFGN